MLLCWLTYIEEQASCSGSILALAADVCRSRVNHQQRVWHIWDCLDSQHAHHILWIQAQDTHLHHTHMLSCGVRAQAELNARKYPAQRYHSQVS